MSDDELIRFADGELDGTAAAAAERAVAADPAAAALVERHRALRRAAAAAFDDVLAEPVPDALLARLRPAATVTDIAAARARRVRPAGLPAWAALAATLVAGFVAGHVLLPARAGLTPDAALARSLDGTPAAAIRIGFSYRDRSGSFCRVYRDERAAPAAGVACRDDTGWGLRVVAAADPRGAGAYRTAAADLPPAVAATVDATIAGTALDAAGEAAAARRHWTR